MVARPVGPFKDGPDYNYQRIKCNVDLLKVIQIGLSFTDSNGRLPTEDGHLYNTWQFNFKFDLGYDLYAADSVEFLQNCGIDFSRHNREGVDAQLFGELLMSSGVVLSDEVRWIAFQGKYDFGYLIKLLTCDELPSSQDQFFDLLHTYFPNIYDIKWLLHNVHHELEEAVIAAAGNSGRRELSPSAGTSEATTVDSSNINVGLPPGQKDKGLEDLAKTLEIPRIGIAHQAGSDSLLTAQVFFRLVHRHLPHVLGEHEDNHAPSPQVRPGSRYRSSSVGSDGLIIEGRRGAGHLRNVLHGLGRGYIQPDRDLASSVTTGGNAALPRPSLKESPKPVQHRHAPPPLSGAIRFDGHPPPIVQ